MKKGLWFVIGFVVLMMLILRGYQRGVDFFSGDKENIYVEEEKNLPLNEFLTYYHSGYFDKISLVDDTKVSGYHFLKTGAVNHFMLLGFRSGSKNNQAQRNYLVIKTIKPLSSSLQELGISLSGATNLSIGYTEVTALQKFLESVGPILLFLLIFFLFAKFMLPKGGALPFKMNVGKQTVKSLTKTKFSDVAGMEEVKAELSEIVDYLKNPDKYTKVGARHPKGVLLYGVPGSGKTLLARAVAGESDVPFFSASGSEFMEMLVGMGAAKVRELFNKAKAVGKAIVFIDEIDAIGKRRGTGYTGGHQEQEQTLNQILTEMDGFDKSVNIVVIAATNRPDVLDPALMRAGRFDRKIMVSAPTYEERLLIFKYYFKDKKISDAVDIESIARRTSGLVGADIENIANEAALNVAKEGRSVLDARDLEYALEKVVMGPEKKVKSISEEEKKIIAYHELGHAVTLNILRHTDPVEKISIVRRGQALGVTWTIPKEDKYLYSKAKFLDEVIGLLGGRASEEVFFGRENITTGASNDFEKATGIIKDMIIKYGMDDDLGPILYFDKDKEDYSMYKPYSEKTAELIDKKIKKYLMQAYDDAKKIIKSNKDLIEQMAKVLLEKEYLTKDEFLSMVDDISVSERLLKEAKKLKADLAKKALSKVSKNKTKNLKSKKLTSGMSLDKKDVSGVVANKEKNELKESLKSGAKNKQNKSLKDLLDKFLS